MPDVVSGIFPDAQTDYYDRADNAHEYTYESGMLVLPVMAGRNAQVPPKIINVHTPYGLRRSKIGNSKRKTPPPFPAPGVNTASGDVFLDGSIKFSTNIGGAQQNFLEYHVDTDYLYVQAIQPSGNPVRGVGDIFQTSRLPFTTDNLNAAMLIAEQQGSSQSALSTFPLADDAQDNQYLIYPPGVYLDPVAGTPISAEATPINFQDPQRLYYDNDFGPGLQGIGIIL